MSASALNIHPGMLQRVEGSESTRRRLRAFNSRRYITQLPILAATECINTVACQDSGVETTRRSCEDGQAFQACYKARLVPRLEGTDAQLTTLQPHSTQ